MLKIYFIDDNNPTELLKIAFFAINGLEKSEIQWIKSSEIKSNFSKFDRNCFFIFGSFSGEIFEYLKSINMRVFGPQLMLDYLRLNETIPKMLSIPLFSAALKNVTVCFTAFDWTKRERLANVVQMMHGSVVGDLMADTSVLVSQCVGTRKCHAAHKRNIPVVLESWIDELWQLSASTDPINGIEPNFIDKNRIPVFHKLKICSTGFTTVEEHEEMRRLIDRNGGQYSPNLQVGETTHLVARTIDSAKYKCALKWKINIVSSKWLTDSVDKQYALDERKYRFTETEFNLSIRSSTSSCSSLRIDSDKKANKEIIESNRIWSECVLEFFKCDLAIADKWTKIVETHGGKISVLSTGEITHVIVGEGAMLEEKEEGIDYVTVNWLESCLKEAKLVDVSEFIVKTNEKQVITAEIIDITSLVGLNFDQYFTNENSQIELGTIINQLNDGGVFSSCRFFLLESLSVDQVKLATKLIIDNRGSIVTSPLDATHQIDPEIVSQSSIKSLNNSIECVTVFYLQSCVNHGSLLLIESDFMFRPISVDSGRDLLLSKCVLSFSGYPMDERKLLKSICGALGAVIQEQMARKSIPSKRILQTTHLIIGKIDQKKYPSSKLWKIPAVTKQWIGACISRGSLVDTDQYELKESVNNIEPPSTNTSLNDNDDKIDSEMLSLSTDENANRKSINMSRKRKANEKQEEEGERKKKKSQLIEEKSNDNLIGWNYSDKLLIPIDNINSIRERTTSEQSHTIMFSNIDKEIRPYYKEAIEMLGGCLNLSDEFDMSVTHLICSEPGRNEKYLSAISAGKWVLHQSYIDESIKSGQWKDEKDFEWGGQRTAEFLEMNVKKTFNEHDRALAESAKRLREIGGKAFKEWRVCLAEKSDKCEKMAKIIKCGGGVVLPIDPLPNKDNVTHFLINKTICAGMNFLEDFCCYKVEFIPYFLSARNEAEMTKYSKKFAYSQSEISSLTALKETILRTPRNSMKS